MVSYIRKTDIRTADYLGPDRRYGNERRVILEQRSVIRFDKNGGDRRSGFARRGIDEGFREQDFS